MRLTQEDAKTLGAVLRQHREDAGLSRAKLGQLIGRDPASLQAYEQGGKKVYGTWIVVSPTPAVLEKLAAALGTTPAGIMASAGLLDAAEDGEAAASAVAVRSVNAGSGVIVSGRPEDISALLGLALKQGLLGKLTFTPQSA